jgi:hypothetical protein
MSQIERRCKDKTKNWELGPEIQEPGICTGDGIATTGDQKNSVSSEATNLNPRNKLADQPLIAGKKQTWPADASATPLFSSKVLFILFDFRSQRT